MADHGCSGVYAFSKQRVAQLLSLRRGTAAALIHRADSVPVGVMAAPSVQDLDHNGHGHSESGCCTNHLENAPAQLQLCHQCGDHHQCGPRLECTVAEQHGPSKEERQAGDHPHHHSGDGAEGSAEAQIIPAGLHQGSARQDEAKGGQEGEPHGDRHRRQRQRPG